ncbi:Haloacid dehalogenase-like hydrolase-domain-containing protein, partial [Ephemerocybe angulata]
MSPTPLFSAIVFDLGDVLFKWSPETKTSISSKTLRRILSCPTWFDYERGRLSEQDCYERVGQDFDIPPSEIRAAFDQARDSLVGSHELIELIRELKEESNGKLHVYAMSNISLPDWEVLRTKPADWSIFDRVFTSGAAGERKPNLGFYRHVISETGVDPHTTIFVDDKHENVLSARSVGFHGIVFDREDAVRRALRNLIGDPVARGKAYLEANSGKLVSLTSATAKQPSVILHENFAQLLIIELTSNRDLVHLVEHERTWNFFHHGKGVLTTEEFPFDVDTTSLGLTVLKRDAAVANSVMDEMLQYVDPDGIMQTYFDHTRPRFDPVVCVNVLSLFYEYGRGAELSKTLDWVYEVLLNRAYIDGTRYYKNAECFLYFLTRLLIANNDDELHSLFKPLLKERIQECIGSEGDALQLAMRILICDFVGIRDEVDLRSLLPLQQEDGSFEIGWIYKYGSSGLQIGNVGLTTAMAVKAISTFDKPANVRLATPPSPT